MPPTSSAADHAPCPGCGRLPGTPPPAFVRRVVAVLFIDIVGFTSLVDGLEPEDVRSLQLDYFAASSMMAHSCSGFVRVSAAWRCMRTSTRCSTSSALAMGRPAWVMAARE